MLEQEIELYLFFLTFPLKYPRKSKLQKDKIHSSSGIKNSNYHRADSEKLTLITNPLQSK
jgi:hypothetical protein